MLSFILFFLGIYLFFWLLPRLWLLFKTVYLLKSKIDKSASRSNSNFDPSGPTRGAGSFHWGAGRGSQKVEKDISHRVKIIEEKRGDA